MAGLRQRAKGTARSGRVREAPRLIVGLIPGIEVVAVDAVGEPAKRMAQASVPAPLAGVRMARLMCVPVAGPDATPSTALNRLRRIYW